MSDLKIGNLYTESFADMSPKEVRDNLEAVAYRVEEKEYVHNLSPEELAQKRVELSEADIYLDKLEEEKKEAVSQFKVVMDPHKEERARLIESIKFRSERRFGQLFQIDDQENKRMFIYDETGVCVDDRPLLPNERQIRMRQVNKVAND